MESTEKPCRHEYVKIFQRRYKNLGRRMVSTKGYLPTGFSNKDFAFLTSGAYCFCTNCRKRLFPNRVESSKIDAISSPSQVVSIQPPKPIDTIWAEESSDQETDEELAAIPVSATEINVEELQLEAIEVADILDTKINVKVKEEIEEEGEE